PVQDRGEPHEELGDLARDLARGGRPRATAQPVNAASDPPNVNQLLASAAPAAMRISPTTSAIRSRVIPRTVATNCPKPCTACETPPTAASSDWSCSAISLAFARYAHAGSPACP